MTPNRDYEAAALALRQLHALESEGRDESPEGERLRAEIETRWHRLTLAEQERLTELSAELRTPCSGI